MTPDRRKILFRVDASVAIGTGHVMRCLTLAQALEKRGVTSTFACRAHKGHLMAYIRDKGFTVASLPLDKSQNAQEGPSHAGWLGADWKTDANQTIAASPMGYDWIIVDHYALDARWETTMRTVCKKLMVIDDLADRPHECDLLLDQNLGRKPEDYQPFVKLDCPLLLGPDYALLRPEFTENRAGSLIRRSSNSSLKTLLITMGGVDQHNISGAVLEVLAGCGLPENAQIKVVLGSQAPWLSDVKSLASTMPWPTDVLVGVADMGRLMAQSDLAIGATGGTSWERCCLGVPTLALILAENQRPAAGFLEASRAVILLGDTNSAGWKSRLKDVFKTLDNKMLLSMSQSAQAIVDGKGTKKCLEVMGL